MTSRLLNKRTALRFVLVVGVVNLFADLTYEGARSITGPFLSTLGASAAAVGIVAGLGEFAGYALRSASGFLADKTGRYWPIIFIGYAVNMLAVPALALAGNWPLAAAFIVAERTGRALRRPAVETLISQTSREVGGGRAFGLNEAMDQGGATVGPLLVALLLALKAGYRATFASLLLSALLCLATLVVARLLAPRSRDLQALIGHGSPPTEMPVAYWLYVAAGALIAAGFADFSLIAYRFQHAGTVPQDAIPLLYALAMGVGALSALVVGHLYDRIGLPVVLVAFFLSALAAPFVFLGHVLLAGLGMVLWGIGLGAQDSVLKAVLTGILPDVRRGTAFGVFDTGFGVAWFLGSAAMGALYTRSLPALVALSIGLQLASLPVLHVAHRVAHRRPARGGESAG